MLQHVDFIDLLRHYVYYAVSHKKISKNTHALKSSIQTQKFVPLPRGPRVNTYVSATVVHLTCNPAYHTIADSQQKG